MELQNKHQTQTSGNCNVKQHYFKNDLCWSSLRKEISILETVVSKDINKMSISTYHAYIMIGILALSICHTCYSRMPKRPVIKNKVCNNHLPKYGTCGCMHVQSHAIPGQACGFLTQQLKHCRSVIALYEIIHFLNCSLWNSMNYFFLWQYIVC